MLDSSSSPLLRCALKKGGNPSGSSLRLEVVATSARAAHEQPETQAINVGGNKGEGKVMIKTEQQLMSTKCQQLCKLWHYRAIPTFHLFKCSKHKYSRYNISWLIQITRLCIDFGIFIGIFLTHLYDSVLSSGCPTPCSPSHRHSRNPPLLFEVWRLVCNGRLVPSWIWKYWIQPEKFHPSLKALTSTVPSHVTRLGSFFSTPENGRLEGPKMFGKGNSL